MVTTRQNISCNYSKRIMQACLCNLQQFFKAVKMTILNEKKKIFFSYFCSKHKCGYRLEPIYVLEKKNVYPCKPQFYYIKVRCKWDMLA